jgi:hypothetical protein
MPIRLSPEGLRVLGIFTQKSRKTILSPRTAIMLYGNSKEYEHPMTEQEALRSWPRGDVGIEGPRGRHEEGG